MSMARSSYVLRSCLDGDPGMLNLLTDILNVLLALARWSEFMDCSDDQVDVLHEAIGG